MQIQRARVLSIGVHVNEPDPVADSRPLQPPDDSLAAAVRFDDDIDVGDPVEIVRVALVVVVAGARQTDRRNTVKPQGVTVGRTLDHHDVTGSAGLIELPQPIEAGLGPSSPSETVVGAVWVAPEGEPELHGELGAVSSHVWYPDGRRSHVEDI